MDLNDNGSVSVDELRRMIESRGFYVSDKEVRDLVDKFDKNRDGRISYAEVSTTYLRYKSNQMMIKTDSPSKLMLRRNFVRPNILSDNDCKF